MIDYNLIFPSDFENYEWEVEAKGWFPSTVLNISGKSYTLNFYDPVRLAQEINDELLGSVAFTESNLIVVPSVNRSSIERAVLALVLSGRINGLVPDDICQS